MKVVNSESRRTEGMTGAQESESEDYLYGIRGGVHGDNI